jgi:hypothetical protein
MERADLKQVSPGLYKSTHDARTVQITEADLAAVQRHARARRWRRLLEPLSRIKVWDGAHSKGSTA